MCEMAERGITEPQILISQLAPSSASYQRAGSANEVPSVTSSSQLFPTISSTTAAMVPVQLTAPYSNLSNSLINGNRVSTSIRETRNSINSSENPSNNSSLSAQASNANSLEISLPEDSGNSRGSTPITNRYTGEVNRSSAPPLQSNSLAPEREHSRTPASNVSNEAYTLSASASRALQASNSSTAPKPNSEVEKSGDIAPPRGKCKLCNSRESDCLILPCGHLVVCFACVNTPAAAMCPVCNSVARSVVRTFLA